MKPYVQTYSVVCGGKDCNASCRYCISKMTPEYDYNRHKVNWRNFIKGGKLAKEYGATTALITGKGEPTLHPNEITKMSKTLSGDCGFNMVELQTNGIRLLENDFSKGISDDTGVMNKSYLKEWYEAGMTTICLSCVHYDKLKNRDVIGRNYPYLSNLIEVVKSNGFSVRICCVMAKGYIDTFDKLVDFIYYCKDKGVNQFTARPVVHPQDCDESEIYEWIKEHKIDMKDYANIIHKFLNHEKCSQLMSLAHGAMVFDYDGQNLCLSNCLTEKDRKEKNTIRQLIYCTDGHVRYSWVYKGAVLF